VPPHAQLRDGAPALTLIHGFMGSAADWDGLPLRLGGFAKRALDLPGHGPRPPLEGGAGFDDVVALIVDELPPDAALLGYSLGARLALAVAARAPSRLRALVLESGTAGWEGAGRDARRELDRQRAAALRSNPEGFVREWMEQPLLASLAERSPGAAEALERRRMGQIARGGAVGWAWAIGALSVADQPDLWFGLKEITVPTLVVTGGRDTRYTDIGRRLASGLASATHHVVPDAGHNVHAEAPTAFARAVTDFLHGVRQAV